MAKEQAQVGQETKMKNSSQVSQSVSVTREDQSSNSFRDSGKDKISLLNVAMKEGPETLIQSSSEGRKRWLLHKLKGQIYPDIHL